MTSPEGTILNKASALNRTSGIVKAGITLNPGLCYIDGANGVKNAPVDGSKDREYMFWYDGPAVTVAAAAASKKITIYGIAGLQVIGKADGVIVVDVIVKQSTTAAHGGQLITHVERTDTVANNQIDRTQTMGVYRGHEAEIKEGSTRTNAADEDTNCVFELGGA